MSAISIQPISPVPPMSHAQAATPATPLQGAAAASTAAQNPAVDPMKLAMQQQMFSQMMNSTAAMATQAMSAPKASESDDE